MDIESLDQTTVCRGRLFEFSFPTKFQLRRNTNGRQICREVVSFKQFSRDFSFDTDTDKQFLMDINFEKRTFRPRELLTAYNLLVVFVNSKLYQIFPEHPVVNFVRITCFPTTRIWYDVRLLVATSLCSSDTPKGWTPLPGPPTPNNSK